MYVFGTNSHRGCSGIIQWSCGEGDRASSWSQHYNDERKAMFYNRSFGKLEMYVVKSGMFRLAELKQAMLLFLQQHKNGRVNRNVEV